MKKSQQKKAKKATERKQKAKKRIVHRTIKKQIKKTSHKAKHQKNKKIKKESIPKHNGFFSRIGKVIRLIIFGKKEGPHKEKSTEKKKHAALQHKPRRKRRTLSLMPTKKEKKGEQEQKENNQNQEANEKKEQSQEQEIKVESAKEKLAKKKEEKEEMKNLFKQKPNKNQQKEEAIDKSKKKQTFFEMLTKKTKIFQEDVDEALHQWELIVPGINLTEEVKKIIKTKLYKSLSGIEVKKTKMEKRIDFAIRDAVSSMIPDNLSLIEQIKSKKGQFVILFLGPGNSGKTTSIAKIANIMEKSGISCMFAETDTSKPESTNQLEGFAKRLDMPITKGGEGADPLAVITEAKKYAKSNEIKCILIDTPANANQNSVPVLNALKKISQASMPDIKIFVGESASDESTSEQAKAFDDSIGIDGVILCKTDKQDESGTVLSISNSIKKPIYYLGTGEELDDLVQFDKEALLKKLRLG